MNFPVTGEAQALVAGSWGGAVLGSDQRQAAPSPSHQQQPNWCSRNRGPSPYHQPQPRASVERVSPSLQRGVPSPRAKPRCSPVQRVQAAGAFAHVLGDKMSPPHSSTSPHVDPKGPSDAFFFLASAPLELGVFPNQLNAVL